MTPDELEALARVAEQAADRARGEILPRFRAVGVEHKADGSPVTEADRRAEQVIRETLLEARPDFGVLGEEHGATGPADGCRRSRSAGTRSARNARYRGCT